MLRKLLKNEFIATSRVIPFTYLALLAAFVMLCVFILTGVDGLLFEVAATMLNMFTILAAYAIVFVTAILLVVRYYKSMCGSESYLTHSIPVKGHTLVLTKVGVSFFWLMCSSLVCALSLAAFAWTFPNLYGADISFAEYSSEFGVVFADMMSVEGMSKFLLWVVLYVVAAAVMNTGVIVFSISLGNCSSFQKLGIGAPILIYFALNLILSIILMVSTISISEHALIVAAYQESGGFDIHSTMVIPTVISFVVGTALIGLSCYIVDKHTSLK